MKNHFILSVLAVLLLASCASSSKAPKGWVSLFDGKSLSGWKVNENPATFKVEDGAIIANGDRAHLFYDGPVGNHNFKNFEFKAKVMTMPGANSGIYFHTQFQQEGWPAKGYEAQVNNSQSDWRRTGSLYAVDDVREVPAQDNVWFDYDILVQGNNIKISIDGKTLVDYTEPSDAERPDGMSQRRLSSGTFALQGHDPGSKVLYKDIMVRILPD